MFDFEASCVHVRYSLQAVHGMSKEMRFQRK